MLLVVPHLNCNLFCHYCYERRYRQNHKTETDYNLEKILKRMAEVKDSYPDMCLHGGEPLMMAKKDVRKILLKMKKLTGCSSIQTNGSLIDDDFIKIFKECSTSVGISYDGPGELSKYRLYKFKNAGIDQKIEKMVKNGVNLSMIIVVSKSNAGTDRLLKKLKDYILKLDKMKISGRLNPCGCVPECELSEKRLKKVYLDLADFCLHHNLKWSPFTDIINGLQGKPRVCTFMGCDIFSTPSAAELLSDGTLTSCMRTNQEYILLRHPVKYDTRNEILCQTPQEFGGCQGCQYWSACYGGCPSMAINNDWRNKTYLCSIWKTLFQFYEKVLTYCDIPPAICRAEKKPEEKTTEQKPGWKHADSDHVDRIEHQDHLDYSHDDAPLEPPQPQSKEELEETKPGWKHADSDHGDWRDHADSG